MKTWYSASDVIRESAIAESTARRYLNTFAEHFRTQPNRKPRRYDEHAARMIQRINELYSDGHDTAQIKDILTRETPFIIDIEDDQQEDETATSGEHMTAIIGELKAVSENMNKLLDIIAATITENRHQREEIAELKRELQELKQRQLKPPEPTPEPKQEPTPRSFWQRIFKKGE